MHYILLKLDIILTSSTTDTIDGTLVFIVLFFFPYSYSAFILSTKFPFFHCTSDTCTIHTILEGVVTLPVRGTPTVINYA